MERPDIFSINSSREICLCLPPSNSLRCFGVEAKYYKLQTSKLENDCNATCLFLELSSTMSRILKWQSFSGLYNWLDSSVSNDEIPFHKYTNRINNDSIIKQRKQSYITSIYKRGINTFILNVNNSLVKLNRCLSIAEYVVKEISSIFVTR